MYCQRLLIGLACLVSLTPLRAQDKERIISGQVRLRSELDGRGVLDSNSVLVHLLRSRIRATVKPAAGITVLAEVQDARYWGQADPSQGRGTTDANADAFDMHQAWAQVDSIFGAPVNLRVGRQEISFANERLVGAAQWANSGRAFDALRATLLGDGFNVDLFGSRIASPAAGPSASQNFYGLWGAIKSGTLLAIDVFGLRDDNTSKITSGEDSSLAVLERYTAGTFVRLTSDPIDVELEGAFQTGGSAASDSTRRNGINAFMASATAGVTLLPESKTRLYVLGTVLSGDGSTGDSTIENFNTLFGTNHRLYGNLDYVPDLGGSLGLVDLSAGITSVPLKGLRMVLEGHVLKPQRRIDSAFGTEIDFTAFWRTTPALEVSGGVGVFMPGPVMQPLVGDRTRYWVYLAGQFDF